MNVLVIHNPFANRWRSARREHELRAALDAAGLRCTFRTTSKAGEAEEIAHAAAARASDDAAARYDAVIAAGGDGTVSEVLNGLLAASGEAPTMPVGVLPSGTGNDFAAMNGVPCDSFEAARRVAQRRLRMVDAARIEFSPAPATNAQPTDSAATGACVRYFGNNAGAGMEPLVTIEAAKIRRLAGVARYGVALVRALWKLRAWRMGVRWDDGEFDGEAQLVSVCNSPRNGGMFPIAPGALLDDGMLDLVLVPKISKRAVVSLLPRILRGTHVRHRRVTFVRTRRVSIESLPPTPLHADGEVLTEAAFRVEITVLPRRVTLLGTGPLV